MQDSVIFVVIKCEPFEVKMSMRSLWKKRKWLDYKLRLYAAFF